MNRIPIFASALLLASLPLSARAGHSDLSFARPPGSAEYLRLAEFDDRQDRRQERGRTDERQDKRDCRREEGYVGQDKRECKQEEVRDGVRGNQGERLGDSDG